MNLIKLKNYTVEQIIDFIDNNKLSKDRLLEKIDTSSLSFEDKEQLTKKINTAYSRINEPLELSLKLFYLISPFGITSGFSKTKDINLQRFEEYRYLKKINTYYRLSTIGMISYILIGLIAALYTRYN